MTSQIIFKGKNSSFTMSITNTDIRINLKGQTLLGILMTALYEKEPYNRLEFLKSAESFLEAVNNDLPLLQYRYSLKIMSGEMRGTCRGMNVRIKGQPFGLWGDLGECDLQEYGINADGTGKIIKTTDIRAQKEIETDLGKVRIMKRKVKLSWPDILPGLIEFLQNLPDETLEILEKARKPSVMELICMFERGGGQDDDAAEMLLEMGKEARIALEEKLKDKKAEKHHHTISFLLQTLFPSDK